ncbi:hypothetical protein ACFL27_00775 [candidate division CSSED10-310 bacterium]|uniref:NAD(P)/FAD-dependent oxidoreductase n=1 Tax=candidate division CSSED10-310 bacterium TaxID=2855610 RepID=A0ABV6YR78_UNCC1
MNNQAIYDVAVVGAGPAGCFFSGEAAKLGLKVVLMEKKKRAAFGHPWTDDVERAVFAQVGLPVPPTSEWDHPPAPSIALSATGSQRKYLGSADVIPLAMVPFIQRLASEAQQAGVNIIDDALVSNLQFKNHKLEKLSYYRAGQKHALSAKIFIDASGINGILRKQSGFDGRLGDELSDHDICSAFRGTIYPEQQILLDFAARHKYEGHINYALLASRGSYSVQNLLLDLDQGSLDILIGFKKSFGRLAGQEVQQFLTEAGLEKYKIHGGGGFIPIRQSLDQLVDHNFMIIGDAACQVLAAHGSGVASALIAAKMAAATAARVLEKGEADLHSLWPYNCEYQRGRGALMAYFRGSQILTESLRPEDAAWLIGSGLVTTSDFENINSGQPINPVAGLPSRIAAIIRRPKFCLDVLKRGVLANTLMAHYRTYPLQPDKQALKNWQLKRDSLCARIKTGGLDTIPCT